MLEPHVTVVLKMILPPMFHIIAITQSLRLEQLIHELGLGHSQQQEHQRTLSLLSMFMSAMTKVNVVCKVNVKM